MDLVLTKKSTFDKTYEKVGVAGPHLSTHDNAISLFVVVATEWKAIKCTSSAKQSSYLELGSLTVRWSKKRWRARRPSSLGMTV